MRPPTYVIAGIGLNHNGDVELAKRLIDVSDHALLRGLEWFASPGAAASS